MTIDEIPRGRRCVKTRVENDFANVTRPCDRKDCMAIILSQRRFCVSRNSPGFRPPLTLSCAPSRDEKLAVKFYRTLL